jgi:hypothetical protein
MAWPRYSNKHIEAAVKHAESLHWRLVKASAHAHSWGYLLSPQTRMGCELTVYSTPRVPENHAKDIRREVDGRPHTGANEQGEDN